VALAAGATAAQAQTLPVVAWEADDGALTGWWTADDGTLELSPLDLVFFLRADTGGWIDAREVAPTDAVSRILRVVPLTARNAVALGALYDAETVVVGEAWVASDEAVPWLGLVRVGVGLDAEVVDVASGARRGQIDTVGLGVARTYDEALVDACAMASARIETLTQAATGASAVVDVDGFTVLVRSTPTALPYVAFRGALRDVHAGVIDVREVYAIEGAVAVALDLDEGVDPASVADAIEGLTGEAIDGARIVSVLRDGEQLDVTLAPSFEGPE